MRRITTHHTNECNKAIRLYADDLGHGGASHIYQAHFDYKNGYDLFPQGVVQRFDFQNGPIKEVGTNGITHEVLLAIIIDRLEGFQRGEWACEENAQVLGHLREALAILEVRTKLRDERGVEGTHEV